MNRSRRRRLATTSLCERRRMVRKRTHMRTVQRSKLFSTVCQAELPEINTAM